MGLFGPKMTTCYLCSDAVPKPELQMHYQTHLIQVVDNDGYEAYTFECRRCGLMDEAWGGGRSNPKFNAAAAITVHGMQKHGISMF